MTGPGYPSTQQSKPKKRPAWIVGGVTIVSFVVLLYVIELFDSLSGHRLDDNGIRPLETDGLMGIVFAPLLHANWDHLIANTVPALILGFLMTLAGMSRFIFATAIVEGKPLRLFNNGNMRRDFTYVDDVTEAVVRLVDRVPQPNPARCGRSSSA